MAFEYNITHTRGDELLIAIPLGYSSVSPRNLTTAEAQSLHDTYPIIEMQVRQTAISVDKLLTLTAADNQLAIVPLYAFRDGTVHPALVIHAMQTLTQTVINSGVYDMQFSDLNLGPFTYLRGSINITQDVSR